MTRVKGKASRRLGSYGPHSKLFKGTVVSERERERERGIDKRENEGETVGNKHSKMMSLSKNSLFLFFRARRQGRGPPGRA